MLGRRWKSEEVFFWGGKVRIRAYHALRRGIYLQTPLKMELVEASAWCWFGSDCAVLCVEVWWADRGWHWQPASSVRKLTGLRNDVYALYAISEHGYS